MLHVHIIQHHAESPPGSILEYLVERKISWSLNDMSLKQPLPSFSDFQLLIVLGGEMNVDQESTYPWLREEKAFLKQAVQLKKTTLGICLGSQLLAEALGARVYQQEHAEIGFHKVRFTPTQGWEALTEFQSQTFFHYHKYRFEIPPGARLVAQSHGTPHQGFVFRENLCGLQFHPEAKAQWILETALTVEQKKLEGPFIEDASEMRKKAIAETSQSRVWLWALLDSMVKKAAH